MYFKCCYIRKMNFIIQISCEDFICSHKVNQNSSHFRIFLHKPMLFSDDILAEVWNDVFSPIRVLGYLGKRVTKVSSKFEANTTEIQEFQRSRWETVYSEEFLRSPSNEVRWRIKRVKSRTNPSSEVGPTHCQNLQQLTVWHFDCSVL